MMGIGWSEMLLIGIVAIILLDPADIPTVLRTLGRITAKTRSLSQELMQALDEASQEAHRPPSGRAPFSQGTQPSQDAGPSLPPPAAPIEGRPSSPVRPPRQVLAASEDAADRFEQWDPLRLWGIPEEEHPEAAPSLPLGQAPQPTTSGRRQIKAVLRSDTKTHSQGPMSPSLPSTNTPYSQEGA